MKWLSRIFRKIDDAITRYLDWLNLSYLYYEEIPEDTVEDTVEDTIYFISPMPEPNGSIEITKCKTE